MFDNNCRDFFYSLRFILQRTFSFLLMVECFPYCSKAPQETARLPVAEEGKRVIDKMSSVRRRMQLLH
jgi:hypothetical protein